MKCKFCRAEVKLGERCQYCGSVAEPFYYSVNSEEKKTEQPEEIEYTVQEGDNLWKIAKRFYGNGWAFKVIAKENKIKNPDLIYPGQILRINLNDTDWERYRTQILENCKYILIGNKYGVSDGMKAEMTLAALKGKVMLYEQDGKIYLVDSREETTGGKDNE